MSKTTTKEPRMKHITLNPNIYGDGFKSADIRITGSRTRSTSLGYHPDQIEEHGFAAREGKLDPWVLYAVQHCTVIDNHGGSAAERDRMTVELAIGEPFTIDRITGAWMLVDRNPRRLEGDGVKPVPARPR
jgi:hypothetical protein